MKVIVFIMLFGALLALGLAELATLVSFALLAGGALWVIGNAVDEVRRRRR